MPSGAPAANSDDTRLTLLRAARDAFGARGYADTHLTDVVGAVGLTKGALYHHFGSKAGLFVAVYTWLEDDLHAHVGRVIAGTEGDAWTRTRAALDAYLDLSARPAYARIVLREARQVPGASTDRELGLALVRTLVRALTDEGFLRPLPLEMTTRVIRAVVDDVATAMAEADDVARARAEGREVVLALLEGLRP